jgi:hypothetical protein
VKYPVRGQPIEDLVLEGGYLRVEQPGCQPWRNDENGDVVARSSVEGGKVTFVDEVVEAL